MLDLNGILAASCSTEISRYHKPVRSLKVVLYGEPAQKPLPKGLPLHSMRATGLKTVAGALVQIPALLLDYLQEDG